jgi:hypothetical protein
MLVEAEPDIFRPVAPKSQVKARDQANTRDKKKP